MEYAANAVNKNYLPFAISQNLREKREYRQSKEDKTLIQLARNSNRTLSKLLCQLCLFALYWLVRSEQLAATWYSPTIRRINSLFAQNLAERSHKIDTSMPFGPIPTNSKFHDKLLHRRFFIPSESIAIRPLKPV